MIFSVGRGLLIVEPHTNPARILCLDAAGIDADAAAVDALARLALAAQRCGYRLVLRDASPELADLIELAGLSRALGVERLSPGSSP